MKIKILTADGRTTEVEVEDNRVNAFDSFRSGLQLVIGNDAPEALGFLVSQLAYTESQVFEKQYLPLQYEQLIPITFEAGEWAESIRYETYDYSGQGRRHSGKGRDINLVDVAWGEQSMPVVSGAIGYDYTQEELRKSSFLRKPLSTARLGAAMEGYRKHMNAVALHGEGQLTGLFNNPRVPKGNAPSGKKWDDKATTPAEVLADINTLILTVWQNTAYNDQVTDIGMPPSAFARLASTPRSDMSDQTILQWLKQNNVAFVERGQTINFFPAYELAKEGRAIAYVKNSQRLVMHIPMPLRFLAPQLNGLSVEVPGEYKYSGVEFRYPKSAYYMDSVTTPA